MLGTIMFFHVEGLAVRGMIRKHDKYTATVFIISNPRFIKSKTSPDYFFLAEMTSIKFF